MAQIATKRHTPEEYLALEAASTDKHEYYDGQIYQMAGASLTHNRITRNISRRLENLLDGGGCESFGGDQRIYIPANGLYTYADVAVACDPETITVQGLESLTNPSVLFEVLSPTTEKYDRRAKFALYKGLETFQNYILVAQDEPFIECFVRQGQFWYVETVEGLEGSLHIPALNVDLALADIYQRVALPEPPNDHPTA